ncbi:hypothetical protein STA3757_04660 [Stanieria sp. NIES-3757]|nr:hypothetical protein STA3757_04660 [Stanieria sp. NIES-3757]
MTQELSDLRVSIVEGRYNDAIAIIDDLEEMSKKAIFRNIMSFLIRLMIHLIKNQIELRLTNSWLASISDSVIEIQALNLKDNKKSVYIKLDEWLPYLEEAIERAIRPASVEVMNGKLKPAQISEQIDRDKLIDITLKLLNLTYQYSAKELPTAIDKVLVNLPGGKEWF